MAIKNFKEIIDDRGYQVDRKDREIFERNMSKSLFGSNVTSWKRGSSDIIEFILYDSNDNQLPQGELGKMVRYIDYETAVNTGIFKVEDVTDKRPNGSVKYFIDTEFLIRDAGYSSGIFKTQVTLLNRRAASEVGEYDKLWIHEISPSRTEIRVLPVNNEEDGSVIPDLEERYNVFINDGNFRDDTAAFVQQYVEAINIEEVLKTFLKIRGKVESGQTYIDLIKKEFKINEFETFLNNIRLKFIAAMKAFVENREYNINSVNFGKALSTEPELDLSVSDIEDIAMNVLTDVIDYYLPKRNIQEKHVLSKEEQVTFDKLEQILKTTTEDTIYDSDIPESIAAPVYGCTDPNAENFNPSAQKDDGSCIYREAETNQPVDDTEETADGRRTTGYVDEDGNRVGSNRSDRTDSELAELRDIEFGDRSSRDTTTTRAEGRESADLREREFGDRSSIDTATTRTGGTVEIREPSSTRGSRTSADGTYVIDRISGGTRSTDETLTEYPNSSSGRIRVNTGTIDNERVPAATTTRETTEIPTRTRDTSISGGERTTTRTTTTTTRETSSGIRRTSSTTTRTTGTDTDGDRTIRISKTDRRTTSGTRTNSTDNSTIRIASTTSRR